MSCPRTEYGPAVAGLAAISGRLRVGRTGAPDTPEWARPRTVEVVEAVVAADAVEVVEATLTGEKCDIADPGLCGRLFLFVAKLALFCAIIVSLNDGLEDAPSVLLETPNPGRAPPPGSLLGGELGLLESLRSNFWAVASSLFMIASALAGHIPKKTQYVPLIFSLTPGLGSFKPLEMLFSTRSAPPPCSTWLL